MPRGATLCRPGWPSDGPQRPRAARARRCPRGGHPTVEATLRSYPRRSNGNGKRGFRLPGIIKFILFAGVLAALVLVAFLTALRPVVRAGIVGWAWDNPGSITRFPFVGDFVREDLGDSLTARAGTDSTGSVFVVESGDTIEVLGPRLEAEGFVKNGRAFMYEALLGNLEPTAGSFLLRGNMTPAEVADALVFARVTVTTLDITFREGLRIEQMTALLQTLDTGIDPQAFYDLAKHPPEELLADYEWLGLPDGASLEGFLYPDTYQVVTGVQRRPDCHHRRRRRSSACCWTSSSRRSARSG